MRILFIEDSPEVFEVVSRRLRRHGHVVVNSTNADHAISRIEEIGKFDVVILDILLDRGALIKPTEEGETGIVLFKKIRAKARDIPVIILTALSKEEIWQPFLSDENVFYQPKPVTNARFIEILEIIRRTNC